jgi:ABC-type antimicrobial peptide transport system permease subunit
MRDANLPVYAVRSMASIVDDSPGVGVRRTVAATFAMFAALALALAAIGVFGVVAHDVRQRRQEIALRVALGAAPHRIGRDVVLGSFKMLGPGLALGLSLSTALAPLLSPVLFGIVAHDTSATLLVTVVLAAVALIATCGPAREAARCNPADVLHGN